MWKSLSLFYKDSHSYSVVKCVKRSSTSLFFFQHVWKLEVWIWNVMLSFFFFLSVSKTPPYNSTLHMCFYHSLDIMYVMRSVLNNEPKKYMTIVPLIGSSCLWLNIWLYYYHHYYWIKIEILFLWILIYKV